MMSVLLVLWMMGFEGFNLEAQSPEVKKWEHFLTAGPVSADGQVPAVAAAGRRACSRLQPARYAARPPRRCRCHHGGSGGGGGETVPRGVSAGA